MAEDAGAGLGRVEPGGSGRAVEAVSLAGRSWAEVPCRAVTARFAEGRRGRPMKRIPIVAAVLLALGWAAVAPDAGAAKELSLAYFMGPKHPMNRAVFAPFAEKLERISAGGLTVRQFPGGALNSSPPRQYSILLDGVADVVFALPGYTGDLFPKTNVLSYPGVCETAASCTDALQRARPVLEKEFRAKVLALWSNVPPALLTRDKPVRDPRGHEGIEDPGDFEDRRSVHRSPRREGSHAAGHGGSPESGQRRHRRHRHRRFGDRGVQAARAGELPHHLASHLRGAVRAAHEPGRLRFAFGEGEGLGRRRRGRRAPPQAEAPATRGRPPAGCGSRKKQGVEIIELPDAEKRRFARAVAPSTRRRSRKAPAA